jgi:thiol:disulfide interchange protein
MQLSGTWFDYIIAFLSGVAVSFTPCVYPVMPMTASFVASFNTKGSKIMGLVISLIYVLGMAITYSALAVIAALTGKVFGQLQNTPIVYIIVANILFFFAMVLSDLVPLPTVGTFFHEKIAHKSLWTVVIFGMAAGLIVGPCTAPVLGTLLLYVASKQNILNGMGLLFFFSYGVGASLILVGTFSGLLAVLPRSGVWLVRMKQLCGLILIILGEYFLVKAGMLFIQ